MNERSTWIHTWRAYNVSWCVRILRHAHLQELGLTHILAYHVSGTFDLWRRMKGPHNYMVTVLG